MSISDPRAVTDSKHIGELDYEDLILHPTYWPEVMQPKSIERTYPREPKEEEDNEEW